MYRICFMFCAFFYVPCSGLGLITLDGGHSDILPGRPLTIRRISKGAFANTRSSLCALYRCLVVSCMSALCPVGSQQCHPPQHYISPVKH